MAMAAHPRLPHRPHPMHPPEHHISSKSRTALQTDSLNHEEAIELGQELTPDHTTDPDEIASTLLGLRPGEVFLREESDGSETLLRASRDLNHRRGIHIERGDIGVWNSIEPVPWDEIDSYGALLKDYFEGRLVSVNERTRYVREDTGEVIEGKTPLSG
jgi:hypothetical protein